MFYKQWLYQLSLCCTKMTKATQGRLVLFGAQFQGMVHYSRDIMMVGAPGSRPHCISTQEANRSECLHSVCSLWYIQCGTPAHGMAPPHSVGLTFSLSLIQVSHYRHAQRFAVLDLVTLTVKLSHHSSCVAQLAVLFGTVEQPCWRKYVCLWGQALRVHGLIILLPVCFFFFLLVAEEVISVSCSCHHSHSLLPCFPQEMQAQIISLSSFWLMVLYHSNRK